MIPATDRGKKTAEYVTPIILTAHERSNRVPGASVPMNVIPMSKTLASLANITLYFYLGGRAFQVLTLYKADPNVWSQSTSMIFAVSSIIILVHLQCHLEFIGSHVC